MKGATEFNYVAAKRNAIRFWEKGRWIFLGLLVPPTVLFYGGGTLISVAVGDRPMLSQLEVGLLFFCCFIGANICYSFAYVMEFFFMGCKKYQMFIDYGRGFILFIGCLLGMAMAAFYARLIAFTIYPADL